MSGFLFDEMFPQSLAARLRDRGYDAISVADHRELAGLDDEALLAAAARAGRVLVTRNVRDFVIIAGQWTEAGREHAGLVLVTSRFVDHPRSYGAVVRALEALGTVAPNGVAWLAAPSR